MCANLLLSSQILHFTPQCRTNWIAATGEDNKSSHYSYLQYSSQVTSPTGTCECHNGTPREAPMLTCPAQDLRVTAWIIVTHASILSCQQEHCEDQPAPRPADHSSQHSIVASHLRTIFIRLQR